MNSESKKEMEQIQRGLEAFLERELGMEHDEHAGQRKEVQEYADLSQGESAAYIESEDEDAIRYMEDEDVIGYMEDEDVIGYTEDEDVIGYTEDEDAIGYTEDEDVIGYTEDEDAIRYTEDEDVIGYMEDEDAIGYIEDGARECKEGLDVVNRQEEEYEDWDSKRAHHPASSRSIAGKRAAMPSQAIAGKRAAMPSQAIAGKRTAMPSRAIAGKRTAMPSQAIAGKRAAMPSRAIAGKRTASSSQSPERGSAAKPYKTGASQSADKRYCADSMQPTERGQSTKSAKSNRAGRSGKPDKSAEKYNASSAGNASGQHKGKKKRKKRSGFRKFIIVVALIILLLGIGLYQLVGAVYVKMNYKEVASVAELPMQEQGVVNILLIGNDSRENGDDGRSDAMILLSVSSKTKTIYMTSLLRDMYVEIPGHDNNRLNAAYSFGGAELLMETIEKNFDISVNRYVLVNFEAFAGLVDAVGGIELELTSEEIEYVNGYLVEYNMLTGKPQGTDNMDTSLSGLVHLNGPQALAYSRNRYLGTDFGRTERQRKVLAAVIKKLPSALLTNAGNLMDGLLPNLTTNLTRNECFRLSLMAGKLLTYEIASDNIPQPGTYKSVIIRKMDVLEVDFEANIEYLKKKLYGES